MRLLIVVCAVAGCYRPALEASCQVRCGPDLACPGGQTCTDGMCHSSDVDSCTASPDAATADDAPQNISDGKVVPICYGTGLFHACFPQPPGSPTTLNGDSIDTMTDPRCQMMSQVGGASVCVIAGSTLEVKGVVTAYGDRPLVLVAATMLTIDTGAILDVSSHVLSSSPGAGALTGPCAAITAPPNDTSGNGAGGGAGGTFIAQGGTGGKGGPTAASGGGGPAQSEPLPTALRGGCGGGTGANESTNKGGLGGIGGGAVDLIAGTLLNIEGSIDASGAGARAAMRGGGGGGGGSGGLIVLDSPTFVVGGSAAIFAVGGGGSCGGSSGGNGGNGFDATGPTDTMTSSGSGLSGDGGAGTYKSMSNAGGSATVAGGGGGGGGGSTGFIGVTRAVSGVQFAPAPTLL